jgi:hypothetical protein
MNDHLRLAKSAWESDSGVGSVAAVLIVLVVFYPVIVQVWRAYRKVGRTTK